MPNTIQVYIKSVTHEADGVLAYELKGLEGVTLPAFTPGAHIDVMAEGIPLRSYSLLNDPSERNRYVIAVAKDPNSRGGSIMIHERLRPGDRLQVSEPRNLFPLAEGEHRSVLIAGGIGITPLWCMAQYLNSKKMDWELHYFARSVNHAALIDAMQGHITQVWLAVSDDPSANATGRYWYHQQIQEPARAVNDLAFQGALLDELSRLTGVELP